MMSYLSAISTAGQTFMWVWWVLWIALFMVLIFTLIARFRKDPLDLLKERYIKGEIGKDEFEEKKRVMLS
jgi:uncharacterized membrane protein